jgi:hypothetical protein
MQQAKPSPASYPVAADPVRLSHLKTKQTEKLVTIRASLVAIGLTSLSAQAQALGLSRSTAWHILNGRHKSSGLSASIIARILSSPTLPKETRNIVQDYIQQKVAGAYGHDRRRVQSFRKRLNYPEQARFPVQRS